MAWRNIRYRAKVVMASRPLWCSIFFVAGFGFGFGVDGVGMGLLIGGVMALLVLFHD